MATIVGTAHINRLNKNIAEVERLIEIQTQLAGAGRRRKLDIDVLNKSGVVLLCACWESYVEDLAVAAVRQLTSRSSTPSVVLGSVQAAISDSLSKANDKRKLWDLAGNGWKSVLAQHGDSIVQRFNTPTAHKVDRLFEQVIGARDVSGSWRWKGMSAPRARAALDGFVKLRGDIAHHVSSAEDIGKRRLSTTIKFIERLAVRSHNHIHAHLRHVTGEEIWPRYRYGSISWRSS